MGPENRRPNRGLFLVPYFEGQKLGGSDMGISLNGGFSPNHLLKSRVFHHKPLHFGYPYFWKHPYGSGYCGSGPIYSECREVMIDWSFRYTLAVLPFDQIISKFAQLYKIVTCPVRSTILITSYYHIHLALSYTPYCLICLMRMMRPGIWQFQFMLKGT